MDNEYNNKQKLVRDWDRVTRGMNAGERYMYNWLRNEIYDAENNPIFRSLSFGDFNRLINIVRNHEW